MSLNFFFETPRGVFCLLAALYLLQFLLSSSPSPSRLHPKLARKCPFEVSRVFSFHRGGFLPLFSPGSEFETRGIHLACQKGVCELANRFNTGLVCTEWIWRRKGELESFFHEDVEISLRDLFEPPGRGNFWLACLPSSLYPLQLFLFRPTSLVPSSRPPFTEKVSNPLLPLQPRQDVYPSFINLPFSTLVVGSLPPRPYYSNGCENVPWFYLV